MSLFWYYFVGALFWSNFNTYCSEKARYTSKNRSSSDGQYYEHVAQKVVKALKHHDKTDTLVLNRTAQKTRQNSIIKIANDLLKKHSKSQWIEKRAIIEKSVLKFGINPDKLRCSANEPTTPLYEAITREDYEFAKVLLDKGSDPDQSIGSGDQRENVIVYARSLRMAQLLCDYRNKNKTLQPLSSIKPIFGGNILHDIIWKIQDPEIVAFYMQKGLDINAVDTAGSTPLATLICHVGAVQDKRVVIKIIQRLVRSGALLEVPAIFAVQNKKNVVQYLSGLIENNKKQSNEFEKKNHDLYTLLFKSVEVEYTNRAKRVEQLLSLIVPAFKKTKITSNNINIADCIVQYYDPCWENLLDVAK